MNFYNSTISNEVHDSKPYAILFIFTACTVGAIVRQVMKGWPIPYTVVLIVVGLAVGALSGSVTAVQRYTSLSSQNPHLILTTFLPVLLFESAFAMDVHIFYKMFWQVVLLAVFGLAVATALSGVMAKMVFVYYHWTWFEALLFGSIVSATDPVAVVALLNDLGTSKQLSTIIEGESLLNDGMAIVLYKIFFNLAFSTMTATEIGLYFPQVALGGFFFGLIAGRVTVFWLQHVFNDALVEISITLASAYLTFYIGEEVLGISGVIAVVMLGIQINALKTSISPEVEVFLHRFWEMLAYLANTLIFIMVGVVIMEKALNSLDEYDLFLLVVGYFGITVIRGLVMMAFSPILMRIGYGLSWQNAVVTAWGGLRGAVGLALALQVYIDQPLIGGKVLAHTAGIVMFTLLVNATTMKKLLEKLGMSDISDSKKISMANAVRQIQESNQRTLTMLKADRFLADADWDMAERDCEVHNPYMEVEEGEHAEETPLLVRLSTCPNCEASVPNEPSPKEFAEMANDGRVRLIKALKVSYWKQFEHGMLSREAVQALINLADTAMDEEESFIEMDDLKPYWRVPPILEKVKDKLEQLKHQKPAERIPPPTIRVLSFMYTVAVHVSFDIVMNVLIIINMVPIILELASDDDAPFMPILNKINYFYCSLYVTEAIWKMMAFRRYYFKDYWNLLDLFIVILSIVDIVIDLSVDQATGGFSPSILKVAKVFRVLRMGRVLRLFKTVLPKVIDFVNDIINHQLSFGYDVGKGYIIAEEEVIKLIDHMVVDKRIARDLKQRSEQNRLNVVRSLGMLQREHPGIAISVKTRQAIRTILNNARDVIHELKGGGLLDEAEAAKLESIVEVKMKRQLSTPASLPPQKPLELLRNVIWLEGMPAEAVDFITSAARIKLFEVGDTITRQGEDATGIYLIVSGMVKMVGVSVRKKSLEENEEPEVGEMIVTKDYISAGNLIGELAMLTSARRNSSCTCESEVQVFFIPREDMTEAMDRFPDLVNNLWRVCGVRLAVPLLLEVPTYYNWTKDKIRIMCERSHIAALPKPPNVVFKIADYMREAILVQGKVTEAATETIYEAPCVLPKNHRLFKLHFEVEEPKILVITRSHESAMPDDPEDNPSVLDFVGIHARGRDSWIRREIVHGVDSGSETVFRGKQKGSNRWEGSYRKLDPVQDRLQGRRITVSSMKEDEKDC
ncbi:sperm-specific sodium:proton exchanger-like [Acropora muricata]|uniref:sperm-specific sodium:proton exchanger-like n=1 Tax=Acropora muricata TaxID=159855 RepID=UPI0010FCA626